MPATCVSRVVIGLTVGLIIALGTTAGISAQSVFINEMHYDNTGTDTGEAIEIAGPAGTDLTGWVLVLYNGNGGASYDTTPLSGVIPDQQNGFGTLSFSYPQNGIQNSSPDGIALVDSSATVVQFLSYEGSFTAVGGPADGQTSTNIGVSESGSEPAGMSLQLTGTGTVSSDFTWSAPAVSTFGSINTGQSFDDEPPPPPPFVCGDAATLIHDVQGTGTSSPLAGQVVTIEGIVVGDFQDATTQLSGFYIQEDEGEIDGDPATSEGIFVFDNNFGVDVQPGDRVRVRGTVAEFGSAGATLTELTSVTNVAVCSSNNDFPRITVTLPVDSPTAWEQYEGMAIRIDQVLTVTETFNLGSFSELVLAVDRLPNPTHLVSPGNAANELQALNDRSRIILDDGSNLARQNLDPTPYPEAGGLDADAGRTVRVGDRVNETAQGVLPIEGVLEQRFGAYRLQPTGTILFNPPDNSRTSAPAAVGGRVRVASFNVLNYFTTLDTGTPACGPTGVLDCRGAHSQEEFTRQRDKIINALVVINTHIVGLIELENNPTASIRNLVDGLNAATQPGRYTFIDTGTIGTDAIKLGFIYQPAVVTPVGSHSVLDSTVDPRAISTLNRPALARTFTRNGVRSDLQHFTVAVSHFKSKGSACDAPAAPGELVDPDTGDGQGNCNLTRTSIAQALIDWLATNPTQDPTPAADRKVLIIGDLNAYAREHPVQALTDPTFALPGFPANPHATYTNMIDVFLGAESYSFVFQGQSGYLDHALVNPELLPLVTGVTEWHINADEPVALDYNLEWTSSIDKNANQQITLYAPDAFRSSDHDPLIVGFNPLCGDLDDDGDVDGRDLLHFLAASRPGEDHRRVDYDSNGIINARDLLLWVRCQLQFKRGAH